MKGARERIYIPNNNNCRDNMREEDRVLGTTMGMAAASGRAHYLRIITTIQLAYESTTTSTTCEEPEPQRGVSKEEVVARCRTEGLEKRGTV